MTKKKFYVAVYVYWDSFEVMCVGQDKEATLKDGKKIAKKMKLSKPDLNVNIYEAPLVVKKPKGPPNIPFKSERRK